MLVKGAPCEQHFLWILTFFNAPMIFCYTFLKSIRMCDVLKAPSAHSNPLTGYASIVPLSYSWVVKNKSGMIPLYDTTGFHVIVNLLRVPFIACEAKWLYNRTYCHISVVIWVRSRRCGCLVTWFCYQMIAKPGNKTAAPPWPDPYHL